MATEGAGDETVSIRAGDALPRQAATEVQHALTLIDPLQALCDGANGVQFPIRIQAVVLAVVRRKTRRIIGGPT